MAARGSVHDSPTVARRCGGWLPTRLSRRYAGWDYLDREFVRAVADCGPFVYVYTDRDMADFDSRVRAIGIEVES
jgi:hypothetical protein